LAASAESAFADDGALPLPPLPEEPLVVDPPHPATRRAAPARAATAAAGRRVEFGMRTEGLLRVCYRRRSCPARRPDRSCGRRTVTGPVPAEGQAGASSTGRRAGVGGDRRGRDDGGGPARRGGRRPRGGRPGVAGRGGRR